MDGSTVFVLITPHRPHLLSRHRQDRHSRICVSGIHQLGIRTDKATDMARKASSIEYLERLVDWAGGNTRFCKLTNIQPGNLSDYLNAKKAISWNRLKRCNEQVFGQPPAFFSDPRGIQLHEEREAKHGRLTQQCRYLRIVRLGDACPLLRQS